MDRETAACPLRPGLRRYLAAPANYSAIKSVRRGSIAYE
jgi:hypothetical protein